MHHEPEVLARLSELNTLWIQLARAGDFNAAWKVSDEALALRRDVECVHWPRHHQFLWRGEPLHGRRVLVRCYHGLGDTIQFARFLPRLRDIAREVILWVQPTLVPLLHRQHGGAHQMLPLHDGDPGVKCDVTIELSELMHVFRADEQLIQVDSPYIRVTAPPNTSPCRRVGIVWRAGEWSPHRSVPCGLLSCLQHVPDVEWVVLQRGPALSEWGHGFGCVPDLPGILDEARTMLGLDLLIAVDTCSAHLAGALGVKVWTLLPFDADWRWMKDREDTPWYPTMRLFRQPRPGDWATVLESVLDELQREFVSMSLRLSR